MGSGLGMRLLIEAHTEAILTYGLFWPFDLWFD